MYYTFTSSNLTNIWAGIGAQLWAISEKQGAILGSDTKAKKVLAGSMGILYCKATKSLTTPFMIYSRPEISKRIDDVWPETWVMPFKIHPLGTPHRQLPVSKLPEILPSLRSSNRNWSHLFLVQPATVFSPTQLSPDDWELLVQHLAHQSL